MKPSERAAAKKREISVYRRNPPVYPVALCKHGGLHLVQTPAGCWSGLYCASCDSAWDYTEIKTALELLERERLKAPN